MVTWMMLWACDGGGRIDPDVDPVVVIDTSLGSCLEDLDCDDPAFICEDEVCVAGDRDNASVDASPLLFDQPIDGRIQPSGDVDWYQFETLEDGVWVLIETSHEDNGEDEQIDTVIRLTQSNGLEHAWADNYDAYRVVNADSSLVAYLPRAGTWYLSVEDVSTWYTELDLEPRGGRQFEYSVSLEVFDATVREGGAALTAVLENGRQISRRGFVIETPGDVDIITLETPLDGELLQISGGRGLTGTDLQLQASFLRDDVLVMQQDDLRDGTWGMVPRAEAGTYEVQLTDATGAGSEDHWFVALFRTYEPGDEVSFFGDAVYEGEAEPNDDPSVLLPVDMNDNDDGTYLEAFIEGTIDPPGDVDAFLVPVTPGQNLTVRCYADRVGSTADLAFDIVDTSGAWLESVTEFETWSAPQRYNFPIGTAEQLVVVVREEASAGGPAAWWRCQAFDTDFEAVPN